MDYEQAMEYLHSPEFLATKPGLHTIRELLHLLGDPQESLKYIHTVGTDWKWATGAFLKSLLQRAGIRTGLFTAHYFRSIRERICIGDMPIPEETLGELTEILREAVDELRRAGGETPTIYELFVALSFLYFRENRPDIVIMEANLGGGEDATNVIPEPEATVVTRISYFHFSRLGNTLTDITEAKAGVVREGIPVFSWMQETEARSVLERVCEEKNAPLHFVQPEDVALLGSLQDGQRVQLGDDPVMKIPFFGDYQAYNAALAVDVFRYLAAKHGWNRGNNVVAEGLAETRLDGQLTVVNRKPLVIIDNAKNEELAEVLYESLDTMFPARQITFVAGFVRANFSDQTMMEMFMELGPITKRVLAVTPEGNQVVPGSYVAEKLREKGYDAEAFPSVSEALEKCRRSYRDEIICCFGSFSLIRSVERAFQEKSCVRETMHQFS